tara:strand:- start:2901 stop:3584 length:684 start_codon:yes stop_codon:yes gene_type:complete
MFKNKILSLILPAYNEGLNISNFINDVKKLNIVDQIICVDNNSTDNTEQEIKKNDVIYLNAEKQGFGAAVKKGLRNCKSDLILICEPDGSFQAKDFLKLLNMIDDYDAVFTSRTSSMKNFYLKYGNFIYAKILSFIFKGPEITDVGSSLRLFKKKDLDIFIKSLKSDGPELQMELTINLFKLNIKIIEIDIDYFNRLGVSNYTGNFIGSLKVALKFTKIVLFKLFKI